MAGSEVLAVDLGTGGPKVARVSLSGRVLAAAFRPVPLRLLPGGGAEQEPEDWWRALVEAARELLAEPGAAGRVAALAVTAQWSGTVLVDGEGRALRPAVIWMDTRGAGQVRELLRARLRLRGVGLRKALRWVRLTGGLPGLAGKDSLAHLLWLREHEPERFRAARWFLEPKDYLNLRLTGVARATRCSIALHWVTDNRDPRRARYHPGLLRLAGLPRDKLPPLIEATERVGGLAPGPAEELGLPPGLPVVGGTPDVQAAAVGSGAVRDFEAHLYVGTSSWLSCHVPWLRTDALHNVASLPAALPGRFLVADEQEVAGEALDYLGERLFFAPEGGDELGGAPAPPDFHARLDRLVERAPPGARGLLFAPWLLGERTPVDDARLRGGWVGLSLDHGRAELARAVYEGVALNTRWLLETVERFVRRRLDPIRFVGGGARSSTWARIFADVLGRTVQRVEDPVNAGVRGAALLASLHLGAVTVDRLGREVRLASTHVPDPARRALYDERYRAFRRLHRALAGLEGAYAENDGSPHGAR